MTPYRTRRATYPAAPAQGGGMMGFLQQAQTRFDEANAANEARYTDILGRLEDRYSRNMDRVGNWGQTAMADSRERAFESMAGTQANLSARGLGGSTIVDAFRQRNARDLDRNLGEISEMRDARMAQYDQTLSKDIADFMERRSDNAPQLGQIAQLAQLYGAGGGEGGGLAGAAGGRNTRSSSSAVSKPGRRRQGVMPINRDEAARQYERDVKQYLQQMLNAGGGNMAGQAAPWGPNGTSYQDRRGMTFRYGQTPNDKQVREWIDRHGGNPYSTRPNDQREFVAGGVSPMAAAMMAGSMQQMMAPLQNAAFGIWNAGFNGYNPNTYGGYRGSRGQQEQPMTVEEMQAEGMELNPMQQRVLDERAEKQQRIADRRNQADKDAQLAEAVAEEEAYRASQRQADKLGQLQEAQFEEYLGRAGDALRGSALGGYASDALNYLTGLPGQAAGALAGAVAPGAQPPAPQAPPPQAPPQAPPPPQQPAYSRAEVVARNNAEAARRREEFLRNASSPEELAIKRGMGRTDFANNNVAPQSAWEAGYGNLMDNLRWGRDEFAPGASARPFVEGDWDNSDLLGLGLDAAGTAVGGAALNKAGKMAGKYAAPVLNKAGDAWGAVKGSKAWDKVNQAGEYIVPGARKQRAIDEVNDLRRANAARRAEYRSKYAAWLEEGERVNAKRRAAGWKQGADGQWIFGGRARADSVSDMDLMFGGPPGDGVSYSGLMPDEHTAYLDYLFGYE